MGCVPSKRALAIRAAALKEGDKMSEYSDYYRKVKTTKGDMISLAQFEGKKDVVLFFYPKADTPGCTKEACKFRDEYDAFTSAGAEVIGISGDGVEAQETFQSKHRLPFTIVSDAGNYLRKGFGVPADMFGMLPGRMTYVISKEGKCVMSFNSQIDAEGHVTKALAAIKALQTMKA